MTKPTVSTWIRALCTRAGDALAPEVLRAGIADRLPRLAAMYGEDEAEETVARLRVEASTTGWRIYYREGESFLCAERRTVPAAVAEEVGALRAELDACDEEGVDDARELLDRVVESVGIQMEMSDVEGIGWAVAIAAAACWAEAGEGLIKADGEGGMEPQGREVAQVLDGD